MKKVAVIILNWNGRQMLSQFLPQVIKNTDPQIADIIVADNGSTDQSLDLLATQFPQIPVIKLPQNYGFAQGYNLAIQQTTNPYIILLNSDVVPRPHWVNILAQHLDDNPRCAAAQPKILSLNHPDQFEYAGAAGGYLDRNGYPYCRGRIFTTIEPDNHQYDTPAHLDWASGAALIVRRHLYIQAGGLDPIFFAHMEEIDLCWRLRTMGYTIDAVPAAEILHLGGGSLPMGNPRKTYLNFRNNLLLLHKNLPPRTRRPILLRRRLLDTIAFLKYLLTLHLPSAFAILRAHRDFRTLRSQTTPFPSSPSQSTPSAAADVQDNPLSSSPNILIDYYLRRRRRFSDLK